ncbi:MAG: PAS domain S-box protein [Azonexus sp.]|nr:PAS domain S-box protein [Azonexus sp.]
MKAASKPKPAKASADFKDHHRAVLDNLPFPAWLKDTESRFLAVNEAFASTFGAVDAESLVGKTDFDIAPIDLAEAYRADDRSVIASRQKKMVEEEIIDQGVRKWFETYKAPVLDQHGELLGTVGFAKDITERKESERILKESEERFRLIFESSGEAILFAWADGRIQSANPAACRMFGYTEEEFRQLGRSGILDLSDPNLPQAIEERSSRGAFHGELRGLRKDGQVFTFDLVSTLFTDAKGELRSINQFRDITERKKAEQLQLESQQRLEVALLGARLGMWDWHRPSGKISFDRRWAEMLGETPEQLESDVNIWASRIHPDDWPIINASMARLQQATGDAFETEYRMRHKNGHWVWILDSGKVVERDTEGEPTRIVGTHLDISARKEAERQLQDQLELLQLRDNALDAISQGVLITGRDQLITYANSGFEAITGYPMSEIVGCNCNFLHGPDSNPETIADMAATVTSGKPFHGEILNYRKDGTPFWNGLSITPVFDSDGQIAQFVGVQRDITSRKQAEDELRNQAARIEAMSRHQIEAQEEMRRRLSADLHDRTSPNLAAISINLGILANECSNCVTLNAAARIEDTTALVDDTVASIREISAELRPPLLDYAGLIPAMESYAQQFRRRTGIEVRLKRPVTHLSLEVNLESTLFRIFQEALTNGAKHSHATRLDVSLTQEQHTLTLSIADNGIGFDAALVGIAPFGSGLGLINMKEMAEFAGGTFTVTSQPGKGTHIHVQF